MLVLPAKAADTCLTWRFHDGNAQHLAANLSVTRLTLLAGEIDERLIRHRFDEAVAHQIQGDSCRADLCGGGHAFVDLCGGESPARADRAVIDQRPAGDDLGASGNRDLGIAEAAVRAAVANSELRDLARAAGRRVLMTLAA